MMKRVLLCLGALALLGCSDSSSSTSDGTAGGKDGPSTDRGGDTTTPPGGDAAQDLAPLVGEGYAVGQISMNWTLNDRDGKPVNLYDYRGKVIYFESGSEW